MASLLPLPDSFYPPLPASQAGFNLHQVIVIRLLRLVWLCPGNKAFDGVELPNPRLVSPGEMEGAKSPCSPVLQFSTLPISLVSSMSVTRQSVASRRIIPVLGNMRSG